MATTVKNAEKRWSDLRGWTSKLVGDAMENPPAEVDNVLLLAAMFVFDHGLPSHQCYWNDRFCVAVMLNLPKRMQQKAAWCVINNGMTGYWEWHTHYGFSMVKALSRIGIKVEGFSGKEFGYYDLNTEIARKIAEYFDLPSTDLRPDVAPGEEVDRKHRELWKGYYHSMNARVLL